MNELWASPFFGISLSILAFWIGVRLQKRLKSVLCNPLLKDCFIRHTCRLLFLYYHHFIIK